MSNKKSSDIDPRLRGQWRALRILSWCLPILVLAPAPLLFALSIKSPGDAKIISLGGALATLLFALILFALLRRVRGKILPELERASDLLRNVAPRLVRAKFLKIAGFSGSYFALWPEGSPPEAPAWRVAALSSNRKENIWGEGAFQAELYLDPNEAPSLESEQGPCVAVLAENRHYWGRLTSLDDLERAWRRQRAMMLAAMAIFVLVLGTLFVLGKTQIESRRDALDIALQSPNWPTAQARVTRSELVHASIPRGKSSIPGYDARVTYVYYADGRHREGWMIRPESTASADKRRVEEILARYPEQAQVTAFFDPGDPSRSTLEHGRVDQLEDAYRNARLGVFIPGTVGVVAMLVVGGVVGVLTRNSRREVEALLGRTPR
jgi:hypothetical protein